MTFTPVGIDIANNVMQLHYIDQETGEIVNEPYKRRLANRAAIMTAAADNRAEPAAKAIGNV